MKRNVHLIIQITEYNNSPGKLHHPSGREWYTRSKNAICFTSSKVLFCSVCLFRKLAGEELAKKTQLPENTG